MSFRSGTIAGFDLWFHMGRIQSIGTEILNQQFPVRYETEGWYGYGYVSTSFYGNIFLYPVALLYNMGLPVYKCYNIYAILINLVTALIAYYSFKRVFGEERWGLMGSLVYTFAAYRIANVYMQDTVGEYTAQAFLPLVFYGFYRIYTSSDEKRDWRDTIRLILPLVLGVSGVLESHILTTEILAMFVVIFALVNLPQTIRKLKELLISLVAIVGLNAFFLIPFLDSYTGNDLYITSSSTVEDLTKYGNYIIQLLKPFITGDGDVSEWSAANEGYIGSGVTIIVSLVLFVVVAIIKKKQTNKYAAQVFVLGLVAAWVSTVYFPWSWFAGDNAISKLISAVQYPTRYMLMMSVCLAFAGVYAMKELLQDRPMKWFLGSFVALGMCCVVMMGIFDYTLVCHVKTVANVDADEPYSDNLYLPTGTDRGLLTDTSILVDSPDLQVEYYGHYNGNRKYMTTNNSTDLQTAQLPVLLYKNIHAYLEDGSELTCQRGDNNRIMIQVPGGYQGIITISFVVPMLWHVAEIITLLTIVILLVGGLWRKQNG